MAVTLATHMGSKRSYAHNRRDPEVVAHENHIDPQGHHETWVDMNERDAYTELFGEAQAEYNGRVKRKDRQVKDYWEQIRDEEQSGDKSDRTNYKHTAYEMIVGVYESDDTPVPADVKKEILKQFVSTWDERNPNLKLIGAYYHADEPGAQEHLHLDFIPWSDGYNRGMRVQTGLNKALEQQGYYTTGKTDTAQMNWERSEREHLQQLCESYGYDVDYPNRGKHSKHKSTSELKRETEMAEREAKIIERESAYKSSLQAFNEAIAKHNAGAAKLRQQKADLDARETALNERETSLNARESILDQRAEDLTNREAKLDERAKSLDERASNLTKRERIVMGEELSQKNGGKQRPLPPSFYNLEF